MSATNRGGERLPRDMYQTPPWVFKALIPFLDWGMIGSILEPCRGDGNIWNQLPKGKKLYWAELNEGRDYLKYRPRSEMDLIVTNPPYSLATEFLMKALAEAKTVAFLLRVNYLGSIDRYTFLNDNEPDFQWTVAPRPKFFGSGNDATEYAWIIWDHGGFVVSGAQRFRVIGLCGDLDEQTRVDGKHLNHQPRYSPGLILPPSFRTIREKNKITKLRIRKRT